jgi:hypothetical protein
MQMLYSIARVMQFIGLLILPVAIAGNLANERLNLMQSLELSSVGILIFSAGWVLQQATRKR